MIKLFFVRNKHLSQKLHNGFMIQGDLYQTVVTGSYLLPSCIVRIRYLDKPNWFGDLATVPSTSKKSYSLQKCRIVISLFYQGSV